MLNSSELKKKKKKNLRIVALIILHMMYPQSRSSQRSWIRTESTTRGKQSFYQL